MAERPNVLFMIADDHRYDAWGGGGDPVVRTPTMDGLAERGVVFGHAYHMGGLSQAVCIPSRAALMTGCNPFRASVSHRIDDQPGIMTLRPELPLLPEVLRRAGYHTHAIGKWHNDRASFARGFASAARVFFGGMSDHDAVPLHEFDPSGAYPEEAGYTGEGFSTELFCDAAVEFLRGYDEAAPFFLYLAFTSPHDPRTPPPPYDRMYDPSPEAPKRIPLPENMLPAHPFDNGELEVRDERLAPWPRTAEVVRRHLADYYGMISHQDAQMARVLAALEESGRADNTVVVYTADHGLSIGQHGLFGKQNLYDHSIRVPLIVGGPGLPRGRRVESLCYMPDLYPTVCGLADVPVPDTVETRSLLPLVEGDAGRETVCAVYKDVQRAVGDGEWKLIRYYRSERGVGADELQLFNVAADPGETRDRSGDPALEGRKRALAGALAAWQRAVGDPWAHRPVLLEE